jgi:hypothetical protein
MMRARAHAAACSRIIVMYVFMHQHIERLRWLPALTFAAGGSMESLVAK